MGSSSHRGERKGQLGLAVTVPMSGTHLKRDEGWGPHSLSVGRSPRVHKVNPGWDPSTWYQSQGFENVIKI